MFRRLHHEEGLAMIVGLSVAFVVLLLSVSVVAMSVHSLESSGYDRERLLAVKSAEAGLNRWFEELETTALVDLTCTPIEETLASGPAASSFEASITYYRADRATQLACPLSAGNSPRFARVISTGSVGGTVRTMETFMRLDPQHGTGVAILATAGATFANNSTLLGDEGNDADVYITSGDLIVNQQVTYNGSVFVRAGTASFSGSSLVRGDLWAKNNVTITNPATIEGTVRSTSGNALGTGRVGGDVLVGGTSIAASLRVTGSETTGVVMDDPPTQVFPQITTSTAPWVAAGYSATAATTFSSCSTAWNWIRDSWGSSGIKDVVIRISSSPVCTFTQPANDTITMHGSLAIINDGGFSLSNHPIFQGTGHESLYLISPYPGPGCTGTTNITLANQVEFLDLNLLMYTPCSITLNNLNQITGQVLGGSITVGNNFRLQYAPVEIPGITVITGFDQDIAYIRETN